MLSTEMVSSAFFTQDMAADKFLLQGGVDMMQLGIFCMVVYGALGLAWMLFLQIPKTHEQHGYFELVLLCATYMAMSAGMVVVNKSLAVSLESPSLITCAQMAMAAGVLACTSFKTLMNCDRKMLFTWLLIPGLFSAMLISSFYTYVYISLSLLTVVRNMSPLVSLTVESVVMPPEKRPQVSVMVVVSILVMAVGAVIYAGGLKEFSVIGILFGVANMVLAVTERMTSRRLLVEECNGLPLEICTLLNNFLGLIPTLALAFITQETAKVSQHAAAWTDPKVLMLMVLSGAIGVGIGYFGFAVQKIVSATSFLVLQNVSKVAVIGMGITFFHDPIKSPAAMAGLALSIGGSYLYGKCQMDMNAAAAEKKKLIEENESSKA